MARGRRFVVVAAGVCAAGVLGVTPAHAGTGYAGSWTATDTDGSSLSLTIQGGSHYAVREVDAAASVCGGEPATVAGSGSGTVDGGWLVVQATLACSPGGNVFRQRIQIGFSYEGGTDTLVDNEGVVWTRA